MYKLTRTIAVTGLSFSLIACGGAKHKPVAARTDTLFVKNTKLGGYTYIYSVAVPGETGRCWHRADTKEPLKDDQEVIMAAPSTLLLPKAIKNSAITDTLRRSTESFAYPLLNNAANTAGACLYSIHSVAEIALGFLKRKTEPFKKPTSFILGTTGIGATSCGINGQAAIKSFWNGYYYATLESAVAEADIRSETIKQDEAANDVLLEAIANSKLAATGSDCAP